MGFSMQYDVAAKVVVEHGKEAMLRWFLRIEPEHVELIEELPQETVTLRRSDFPLWVRTNDGKEQIVVLEFQTRWQWEVPLRLLEYVVRFRLKYRLPVVGVVVLFNKREGVEEVYEDESIRFRYHLVRMWDIESEEILQKEEVWLYPFVPVMCGKEGDIFEAEEKIYRSGLDRRDKADLLTALTIFSGFKGEKIVRKLLRRRRDIMIESPAYDIIKEEGIKEGLQQGMLEEAREMVLEALSFRFGVVPVEAVQEIKRIEVREVFKQLHRVAMSAETLDEFRKQLGKAIG